MPPQAILSRADSKPGSLGLSGAAGLQVKSKGAAGTSLAFKPKKFGLQKPVQKPSGAFGGNEEDELGDDRDEPLPGAGEAMQEELEDAPPAAGAYERSSGDRRRRMRGRRLPDVPPDGIPESQRVRRMPGEESGVNHICQERARL